MPANSTSYKDYVLDARPDRLDLRDREYRPHLRSLPNMFPAQKHIDLFLRCYRDNQLILNQGQEGACTGFGLAATINYLIWRDNLEINEQTGEAVCALTAKELRVSERMLYHIARVYDEWDGEDYSGSSCRGAMKGWHRHGVCRKVLWEYNTSGTFIPPKEGWEQDALKTTLGAYYRINHDSVVDMQAAIVEVGAIYCSSAVHQGWWLNRKSSLPTIKQSDQMIGGHAYCIIGYNEEGFIVQNSWGEDWGWNGFALLSYEDWVDNGSDAWVVARGVPVLAETAPSMFANNALQETQSLRSLIGSSKLKKSGRKIKSGSYQYPVNSPTKPWSENRAQKHALIITNNGRPKHTVIAAQNCEVSAKIICSSNVEEWLQKSVRNRRIAIYAHGGMTSEEDAIKKIQLMAPSFYENDIYPIFVVWKTGLRETIKNIIADEWQRILSRGDEYAEKAEGAGEWISNKTDAALEAVARNVHAKSIWSEMKENAVAASDRAVSGFAQNRAGKKGAMVILSESLTELSKQYTDLELHLVGHSAGSILLGQWLDELTRRKLTAKTASLFAPACTIDFANKTYKKAIDAGVLPIKGLYIHNMDDEREKADSTGSIYRKSLLYFVSRALEDIHKMPLLGLQAAWDPNNCNGVKSGGFNDSQKSIIKKWSEFIKGGNKPIIYSRKNSRVLTNINPEYIDLRHSSFDNDIYTLEYTLKKIRNGKLKAGVENLSA
ncbi:MAG: C1 family peptidase [Acidiferrobacterales bacterium]|nr:C1 family peptidase [Acidiferrobacterales bacterium]